MKKDNQTHVAGRVLIIIPARNEEPRIAGVLDAINASTPYADIVVIDDGSFDKTAAISNRKGAFVISLPFHMGYGAALQTGYKYADANGYDYAVQMDADGQHEPDSIARLLDTLTNNKADVAIGSRFLENPRFKTTVLRRAGMFFFSWLTTIIVGERITDPTSGFQAHNKKAINQFCASEHYPSDFPDADVIIMLYRAGLAVLEVPVIMYPCTKKRPMHRGFRPVYYVFKMCLSIFLTLFRKSPF